MFVYQEDKRRFERVFGVTDSGRGTDRRLVGNQTIVLPPLLHPLLQCSDRAVRSVFPTTNAPQMMWESVTPEWGMG